MITRIDRYVWINPPEVKTSLAEEAKLVDSSPDLGRETLSSISAKHLLEFRFGGQTEISWLLDFRKSMEKSWEEHNPQTQMFQHWVRYQAPIKIHSLAEVEWIVKKAGLEVYGYEV